MARVSTVKLADGAAQPQVGGTRHRCASETASAKSFTLLNPHPIWQGAFSLDMETRLSSSDRRA